ncbi:hypothetical protein HELRODRAFT_161143 [Helobdella robusta]|uniref:VWFC domain-containing protein n=1 Tax=Helobdella robusta TaxID=6412 RepID=T1ER51_HELRO|nr:hypothetical protein HELRODRAFT_161143 [Helobdella robusta]ESO01937.1 hypothetical protein HELRODRAFT_161143 [Helobdella robusta]
MLESSGMCFSSDGRYFVEGETWVLDKCTHCICHQGTPLCSIETCPPLLCYHPIALPDSCCLFCLINIKIVDASVDTMERQNTLPQRNNTSKVQLSQHTKNRSCYSGTGAKANHGDSWKVSSCQSCVCRDGSINCFSQTCPILGCSKTVLKKGHCCPSCVERSILYCVYNNVTYDNSESWLIDECTTCACMDGQILCTVSICEALSCHKTVTVPGKCCPVSKEQPSYFGTKNESTHPLNVTLIVVLVSIIAILAIAIIVLLGMLLWLRPRLSRHLRRASSITLPPSMHSLNPLNLFNHRHDHQQLNDEKSVSSSLLPLSPVTGMIGNNNNVSNNNQFQQKQQPTVGNLLLKYNKEIPSKLRLSINESHPYDAPSLSAAVSSMTTASLSSSSSAVKKRLSSSDGYSEERRNVIENVKNDTSHFNKNISETNPSPNHDFSCNANVTNVSGDLVKPINLPPLPPRMKPMMCSDSNEPSPIHQNIDGREVLQLDSDDKTDKDDMNNLNNDEYDDHVLNMMESYSSLNGDNILDVVVTDGPVDNNRANSIFRSPLKSSRFSDLDNDLTRHLLNPSPSQDIQTNADNLTSNINYSNNKNRNSSNSRDNKMSLSNRKSW